MRLDYSHDSVSIPGKYFSYFPRLSTLVVKYDIDIGSPVSLPTIRHLSLANQRLQTFLSFLASCPNLTTLQVEHISQTSLKNPVLGVVTYKDIEQVTFESLKTACGVPPHVNLPHLSSLTLRQIRERSSRLTGGQEQLDVDLVTQVILDMLRRSTCSLDFLLLDVVEFTSLQQLLRLLDSTACRSLQSLSVVFCGDPTMFIHALSTEGILPRLRSLSLNWSSWPQTHQQSVELQKMLLSRCGGLSKVWLHWANRDSNGVYEVLEKEVPKFRKLGMNVCLDTSAQ